MIGHIVFSFVALGMPRQTEAKRQIDRIVGKNIAALMERAKMEPTDIAKELKVSKDHINKLLRGDRGLNIAQLIHLAQLFSVDLERIAYDNGQRPRIIPFLRVVSLKD